MKVKDRSAKRCQCLESIKTLKTRCRLSAGVAPRPQRRPGGRGACSVTSFSSLTER